MIKLDTVRTAFVTEDPQAWDLARRVLANPKTTAYKRTVVEGLLDAHPEPVAAEVAVTAATIAPAPVAGPGPEVLRLILAAAGLADDAIAIAMAALGTPVPADAPVPAPAPIAPASDKQAVVAGGSAELSEEDAGDLVIEADPVLQAMRREARRRVVAQYEARVLKLSRPVGFSQYMRGAVGREAFEENLRDVVAEAIAAG